MPRRVGGEHGLASPRVVAFEWCESNGLDPLVGIRRAHVELYIRGLGEAGLMASSTNTMMHGVRGLIRFAHIDGLIPADPAVYARLPKVHSDESRTQELDRLELIRFRQVAQTVGVHHSALARAEALASELELDRETDTLLAVRDPGGETRVTSPVLVLAGPGTGCG